MLSNALNYIIGCIQHMPQCSLRIRYICLASIPIALLETSKIKVRMILVPNYILYIYACVLP